jgi:hypothetical protein
MRVFNILLALYFFILSLAPNMQGAQFLNLSNFIEHYQDHLLRNENSDLLSFVQEHYFNNLTEFEKDHKHLPLKVNIQVATGVMNFEIFDLKLVAEEMLNYKELATRNESKNSSYYNKNFHSIWQPPQIG